MRNSVKCSVILLAAGQGKRMNSSVPKQYLLLAGKPIIYYSLKVFEESSVDEIILVTGSEEVDYCQEKIVNHYGFNKVSVVTAGGKERHHSVYNGLQKVNHADYILVHDGARPFVTKEIIERTISGAVMYQACAAGMPVKDTIKIVDDKDFVSLTPNRDFVWLIQTPQTFAYPLISDAYERLSQAEKGGQIASVTDDAMVIERITGEKVKLVEGSYENIKVTTPSDLLFAQILLKSMEKEK
jgi:2-C-methyl-D-erythritol 4-phosphate cytidylyltransferase